MISYSEALSIILDSVENLDTEKVNIADSLHRVLATDIYSDVDMPPFNKAAMDGFACKLSDLQKELEIIEEIPAGKTPEKVIGNGQCAKIMTGAVVPDGADCVIMIEHIEYTGKEKIRFNKEKTNINICYKGEDVRTGDKVLLKGTQICPQHIATLASVGQHTPEVFKLPSVAVLSTGNELVEPHIKPLSSQIRNSNGYQLLTQCKKLGLNAFYAGIVSDDKDDIKTCISELLEKFDVVIISGGVSMGDYDYVPEVLAELGIQILFQGMKVKPGKRIIAGKNENKNCWAFGMPGNPVSSFVLFEVLVKPFLLKLMKSNDHLPLAKFPLYEDYKRKEGDKLFFIPVEITNDGFVKSVEYHGSAHIHSYTKASAIMEIPEGTKDIKKGEYVNVRPL